MEAGKREGFGVEARRPRLGTTDGVGAGWKVVTTSDSGLGLDAGIIEKAVAAEGERVRACAEVAEK
jgi:hypothetical protein